MSPQFRVTLTKEKLKSFKKSAAPAQDQPKSCFLQELFYF